jgi:SAM-dependent methyltransferase
VLCGLGLMFFPDEQAALREIRRVLRPARTLALSVWGSAEEVPLVECALSCMRRLLPPPKVARPSIFRFGDPDGLQSPSRQRRLSGIEIRPRRLHSRFADAASLLAGLSRPRRRRGGKPVAPAPEKQQALAAAVADELAPHAVEGGYRLTSTVLVASAGRYNPPPRFPLRPPSGCFPP